MARGVYLTFLGSHPPVDQLECARKSWISAAISSAWVSNAKWPVSKNRTIALGMSRLNASAPGGRKKGSFFPHTPTDVGGPRTSEFGRYVTLARERPLISAICHRKPPTADIVDYDLAYFDADLSPEAENEAAARVGKLLADLPVRPDVKNQARVHLWHEARFGYQIRPYASSEDAIATWPTTATAVGVRCVDRTLTAYAPFSTADLFDLVVRPNRVKITPEIYTAKVARWIERWLSLKILAWEEGVGVSGIRRAVQPGAASRR